jgi:hypothetical protein
MEKGHKRRGIRYGREFWEEHFKTWKNSGLSQTQYCKDNNLTSNSFLNWKKKFQNEKQNNKFIEIPAIKNDSSDVGIIDLKINDRYRLSVSVQFDFKNLLKMFGL